MKKLIEIAGAAVVVVLGMVMLSPSALAMLPPPGPGGGQRVPPSSTFDGIAVWQVVAIALVAVLIGSAGTYLAQRTHRTTRTSSVTMA